MRNNMYDEIIRSHYAKVAKDEGSLSSCTMSDDKTRQIESNFILHAIQRYQDEHKKTHLSVLDVGCGNGYTLELIHSKFPNLLVSGIEFTSELRALANKKNIPTEIGYGDVRDKQTIPGEQDVIVCQRVLINLLNEKDQIEALNNIAEKLVYGGILIIIEAFESGLASLNKCREELGMSVIPPAHHNLYLQDDFFDSVPVLKAIDVGLPKNILSSHYFISRVLHDVALEASGADFVRNSLFVSFFDEALPMAIGNFSPLQCHVFKKIS
jgi:SAM-dependent methyltransferase